MGYFFLRINGLYGFYTPANSFYTRFLRFLQFLQIPKPQAHFLSNTVVAYMNDACRSSGHTICRVAAWVSGAYSGIQTRGRTKLNFRSWRDTPRPAHTPRSKLAVSCVEFVSRSGQFYL